MRSRVLSCLFWFFEVASCCVAGCSSSDGTSNGPNGSSGSDGTKITCENDERDVYVANLRKPGQGGALTFVLAESVPAPPAKGRNNWTVRVLDRSGTALSGAAISVNSLMPAHGHSASTPAIVTPSGDSYTIAPITLFMPGLWEVKLDADASGIRDTVVFKLCIAG